MTTIMNLGAGSMLAGAMVGGVIGDRYQALVPGIFAGLVFGLFVGIGKMVVVKRVLKNLT